MKDFKDETLEDVIEYCLCIGPMNRIMITLQLAIVNFIKDKINSHISRSDISQDTRSVLFELMHDITRQK